MANEIEIRTSNEHDSVAIEQLYPRAFPDEDLVPLVRKLLRDTIASTSFVAATGAEIVAHVVFSDCGIAGTTSRVSLLGPLAVTPGRQGRGIGSALVREGLQYLRCTDTSRVLVLGDPAFYRRLGFAREDAIRAPYPLPDVYLGAWQSQPLTAATDEISGILTVPEAWREASLWTS